MAAKGSFRTAEGLADAADVVAVEVESRLGGPSPACPDRAEISRIVQHVASASLVDRPIIFQEYVTWANRVARAHRVPWVLDDTLSMLAAVVVEHAEDGLGPRLTSVIDAGRARLDAVEPPEPPHVAAGGPMGPLAADYLRVVLEGDRRAAVDLVLSAAAGGAPLEAIYLHVIQPVQLEIGRLWELGEITVGREHLATAIAQLVMSRLTEFLFDSAPASGTVVAAGVRGDLHDVGLRMVVDFLELDGWRTDYLGANVPAASVVAAVAERRADLVALSAATGAHVVALAGTIAAVRAASDVAIMVGGRPFRRVPDLYERVGADACAEDAQAAVAVAAGFRPATQ